MELVMNKIHWVIFIDFNQNHQRKISLNGLIIK